MLGLTQVWVYINSTENVNIHLSSIPTGRQTKFTARFFVVANCNSDGTSFNGILYLMK